MQKKNCSQKNLFLKIVLISIVTLFVLYFIGYEIGQAYYYFCH